MAEARIERIVGRQVWDSRGRPTVEAEIVLDTGASGRAIAPAGASTGTHEAVDLRDGGLEFGGFGVDRAVANVNREIAAALRGMRIADQSAIDHRLIELDGTPNKARLGGNATIAVSMAALHAAAATCREPLWRILAAGAEVALPMPMIQIFGGRSHAGRRVDIQDFLIMPIAAASFDEALVTAARVYRAASEVMAERGRLRGAAPAAGRSRRAVGSRGGPGWLWRRRPSPRADAAGHRRESSLHQPTAGGGRADTLSAPGGIAAGRRRTFVAFAADPGDDRNDRRCCLGRHEARQRPHQHSAGSARRRGGAFRGP